VVTGHIVQTLRLLNPRWWLADFLNQALATNRFRRQFYRRLRIEPWCNQARTPANFFLTRRGARRLIA
jgi:hypothetical protein